MLRNGWPKWSGISGRNQAEYAIKKEEYREIKPYWHKRLLNKQFDAVHFRNGYAKDAPCFTINLVGLYRGLGIVEWGAPEKKEVFILRLGEIITTR